MARAASQGWICLTVGLLLAAGHALPAQLVDGAFGTLVPIFADGLESGNLFVWDAGPGPTQVCPFSPDANGFFTLASPQSSYVVRLPVGYDVENPTPQRLLVALHGCGDSAFNFATWAAVPFALRASQDYIAISVGGRDGQCWNLGSDGPVVAAAIAHVRSCFYVHQREIVVAGYSSGGGLAYKLAMTDALFWAGVLVENSSLSSAVGGAANVDSALDAAAWKLHVGHSARTEDASYLIAGVRLDRDKMLAHSFPLQYRELPGDHNGTSEDWSDYLLPLMTTWTTP